MVAVPIPPPELKGNTWYYGVRCACGRLQALCEDLFAGKTDERHLDCADPVQVVCACGRVLRADRLYKFKTP